jgi:hypothetical protein
MGIVPFACPYIEEPPVWAVEKRALVLMDVFSEYHGMYLAHMAKQVYGVATVVVFSDYMKGYFLMEQPSDIEQMMTMCMPTIQEQKENWCRPLEGYELVGISCESDSGLADAKRLGVSLNLSRHNGFNEARRNKYLMLETVGAAGLPVVKQRLSQNLEEACEFATRDLGITTSTISSSSEPSPTTTTLQSPEKKCVVVKPIRGVASQSLGELTRHWL